MASDPFIELLTKQSLSRLRDMEAELDEALRRIGFERDIVRRAISEKQGSGKQLDLVVRSAGRTGVAEVKGRRGLRRDDKRRAIIAVMETSPERVWMPIDVARALTADGVQETADSVRVMMRRMVGGELQRPPDGNGFILARESHGLDQASPNGVHPDGEDRGTATAGEVLGRA